MPHFKTTFLFNQGRWGWSETWYQEADTIDLAALNVPPLAAARAQFLSASSLYDGVRVSDEKAQFDSHFGTLAGYNVASYAPNVLLPTDAPWNGLLLRVSATSQSRRMFLIRGVPDDWVQKTAVRGAFDEIPIRAKAGVEALSNVLTAAGTPWRLRTRVRGPDADWWPVTGVSAWDASFYRLAVDTNLAPLVSINQEIQFTGFKSSALNDFNRTIFKVIALELSGTAKKLIVAVKRRLHPQVGLMDDAKVRRMDWAYTKITRVQFVRVSKRDTGRAFFVTRGRQHKAQPDR